MHNKGLKFQRLHPDAGNPKEVIFAKHWESANTGTSSTLNWLLGPHNQQVEVSGRERIVAATVVQWLGSPIGFNFLEEALKECGYTLEPIAAAKEGK